MSTPSKAYRPVLPKHGDKVAVYYHDPCLDGCMAAGVLWNILYSRHTPLKEELKTFSPSSIDVDWLPAKHGVTEPPALSAYDLVYVLDFSFAYKALAEISRHNTRVCVIDHHATAVDELMHSPLIGQVEIGDLTLVLDKERSGARLTHDYFAPALCSSVNTDVPIGVAYVEDRDLWRFKLRGTRAFCAALRAEPFHPAYYAELACVSFGDARAQDLEQDGRAVLSAQEARIREYILPNTYIVGSVHPPGGQIIEGPFYVVNTPVDQSETAQAIADEHAGSTGRVIIWSIESLAQVRLGFRCQAPLEVRSIAEAFGGGGHDTASGAIISIEEFIESGILPL